MPFEQPSATTVPPKIIKPDNSAIKRIAELMEQNQYSQMQNIMQQHYIEKQNLQQQQQALLVNQMSKMNIANQMNVIKNLNGNENRDQA